MNRTQCTCENPGTPWSIHKLVVFRNPDGTFSKVYTLRRIVDENDEICADDSDDSLPPLRNKQRPSSLPPYSMTTKRNMAPRQHAVSFADNEDQSDDHISIASSDSNDDHTGARENRTYNEFSPKWASSFKNGRREVGQRADDDHNINQTNYPKNRKYHIHSSASLETFGMACLKDGSSFTEKRMVKTETYKPRKSRIDGKSVRDPSTNCQQTINDKHAQRICCCRLPKYELHGFITSPSHLCVDSSKLTHQSCNCENASFHGEKDNFKTNKNVADTSSSGSPEFLKVAIAGLEQAMELLLKAAEIPADENEIVADISEINELLTSKIDSQDKNLKTLRNILAIILDGLQTTLRDDPNKSLQLTDIENKLKGMHIDDSENGQNADENEAYNVTIQGLEQIVELLQRSIDVRYEGELPSNLDELKRLLTSKVDRRQQHIQKLKATLGDMLRYLQSVVDNDPNKSMDVSKLLTDVSVSKETPIKYPNGTKNLTEVIDNTIKGLNQAIDSIEKTKDGSDEDVLPSDLEIMNKLLKEKLEDHEHQLEKVKAIMETIIADLMAIVDNKKETSNNLRDLLEEFSFEASTPAGESTRMTRINSFNNSSTRKESHSAQLTEPQESERMDTNEEPKAK